jgi:excisionase family DNA binding protein
MKRTPPPLPQFYTPADIADRLKVTRRTVYTYIHSGQLPATKVGPKQFRITVADLAAFLLLRRRVGVLDAARETLRPEPVQWVEVASQAEVPPLPFEVSESAMSGTPEPSGKPGQSPSKKRSRRS